MDKKYLAIFALCMFPHAAWAAPDMNFTVTASEAVTVDTTGGTPRLAIDIGGTTKYATYVSGSGSSTLTFTYTTQPGDIDLDGISITSPLQMNGGTIMDAAGNALSPLTFSVPTTTGVLVDHPSLAMDFVGNDYILNGTHYNSLTSFLTAAGGSFSRASVGTYIDASGNVQTASSGVPRFTHDRVTNAPQGLMIEEARTNHTPNSTFAGMTTASYTASTTVANWVFNLQSTLTGESIDITPGTASGLNYLDIRMRATNSTGVTQYMSFSPSADATVTNGTVSSASAWLGITANTGGCTMSLQNRSMTGVGGYITGTTATYSGIQPFEPRATGSITHGATAGRSSIWLFINIPNGTTCDITTRYAAPQFEIGAFPTSFIPTSGSAVTRPREDLLIPAGSWFNSSASTLMGQAQTKGVNVGSTFADLNNNSFNHRFQIRYTGAGIVYSALIATGGTVQASIVGGSSALNVSKKLAMAATTNDAAFYADGANRGTDNALTMPTITQLRVGGLGTGSESLNGAIQTLKYYPVRIPNAQLQLLTQ